MNNPNHPKKGSSCKVQPIKNLEDIQKIKVILTREQDKCLFTCGINLALRAGDLAALKIEDVKDLKPMDTIEIKESKTGKTKNIVFNNACVKAIKDLVKNREDKTGYLFQGRWGKASTIYIHSLVKQWTKKAKLKGNYGSHSLRKTWSYHAIRTFGVPLPDVMHSLNHSNVAMTLRYCGINAPEIEKAFSNEL